MKHEATGKAADTIFKSWNAPKNKKNKNEKMCLWNLEDRYKKGCSIWIQISAWMYWCIYATCSALLFYIFKRSKSIIVSYSICNGFE